MSAAFRRMAYVDCSTKRKPAFVDNKRGPAVEYLTGLKCLPLDPVTPETEFIPVLNNPFEQLQTALQGDPDIVEGDILVVASVDYKVNAVADWPWRQGADTFRRLFIEEPKE